MKIRKNDKKLKAFVDDVIAMLMDGKRHQTSGFGTFSTCARKATLDRAACKMAIFRASNELREFSSGGMMPAVSGPHAEIVIRIIKSMQSEQGLDIHRLGRIAVVPVAGKKPTLIFHSAEELNSLFDES